VTGPAARLRDSNPESQPVRANRVLSQMRRGPQRTLCAIAGPFCAPLQSLACQIQESVRKASFDGHPLHFPLQRGTGRDGRPA
jgi:hypothetical protein